MSDNRWLRWPSDLWQLGGVKPRGVESKARRFVPRLESLEDRLTPTAEVEPNNTIAAATTFLRGNDVLTGTISTVSDIDIFQVTLSQGDTMRVAAFQNAGLTPDPGQLHMAPAVELLDPFTSVRGQSLDGRALSYVAPRAGTYYVRCTSASALGAYTGNYSVAVSVSGFSGTTETVPDNSSFTVDPLGNFSGGGFTSFRGSIGGIGTAANRDDFSFTATAGQTVVVKFSGVPAGNPSVRLLRSSGTQVAASVDGTGLHATLPINDTYLLRIGSDNTVQSINGGYVGSLLVLPGAVVENASSNSFVGAQPWSVTTTASRAVGRLSYGDVDVFAVDFTAGNFYAFALDTPDNNLFVQGRILKLYNEFGQLLEYTTTGSLRTEAATGFGFRAEKTGRHYLAIETTNEATNFIGTGAYSIMGQQTANFPTQRDVPLYFLDFTDQMPHLSTDAVSGISNTARIPLLRGLFESQYDIYDVDVTTTNPGAGTFISHGMGNFNGNLGGGLGGSFNLNASNTTPGTRRSSGDAFTDSTGSAWTRLADMQRNLGTMLQETGHAAGIFAHARHPLTFMAYDRQSSQNPIGSYFPFPWTDSRVPEVEIRNQRDYLDLTLQSGRFAIEAEPNDISAQAQDLAPLLSEMTRDSDPRNDRVTVLGRLNSPLEYDFYRFTATAGQRFAIDIDSAELQNPLNARLVLLDANNNILASSSDELDRESGLFSVDPYLTFDFATAGNFTIQVVGEQGTFGNYRLKLTAGQAFDTAGPRVIAAWPNGGSSQDSSRQLIFWTNDQIDPATLAGNVIVSGPSGAVAGTATFDPLDSTLVWFANTPLSAGAYTVTLRSGATGIKDLRGNQLDGETGGTLTWPSVSGNGVRGGDFVTTFTVTGSDTTAAAVTLASYRNHPYNRGLFTLTFSDELSFTSATTTVLTLRGDGADNVFNTSDDTFKPVDVFYDKMQATSTRDLLLYTRGYPDSDRYRIEGSLTDAAGNTVTLAQVITVTAPSWNYGPSVVDLRFQPNMANTWTRFPPSYVTIQFSGAINPATLTTSNVVLRYSPDATFFDGNDVLLVDADGVIAYDASLHQATFQVATSLAEGHYLLELEGDAGGITNLAGRLLDGEYLDSNIAGNSLSSLWRDAPSGDGLPGGDYRAYFRLRDRLFGSLSLSSSVTVSSTALQTTTTPLAVTAQSSGSTSDGVGTARPMNSSGLTTLFVPAQRTEFGSTSQIGSTHTASVTVAFEPSGTATGKSQAALDVTFALLAQSARQRRGLALVGPLDSIRAEDFAVANVRL